MRNFVGRYDYINPKYTDVTWGVSDEDMFMRGIEEIRKLTEKGRTFALLQTVSNHPPFDLPPPAPFPALHGPEQLVPWLNGMRYSDWALGKFFEHAERETWFSHTLFVIVGDHGFSYEAPKAMMNLSSYHVPLLIYYPGDTEKGGQVNHTVSSQVDVLPTVMGLMGIHNAYQAWGRDLFRLDPSDQGWAVIKPSGGHETVGFIRGDILFVTAPKIAPSVYRYRLNPWDATKIQMPAETASEFAQNLYGYVQSGIKALLTYRAGVSAEDVSIMKK
jgi:phosphoglycerol transferase MdoB-like AlkP superfamily enzyme